MVDEGDSIVVPFGSHTQAILRRIHDGGDDEMPEAYALIGDCYVDGIMEGELMELYRDAKIEAYTYHLR